MTAYAIAGLVPHTGTVEARELLLHNVDLLDTSNSDLPRLLGTELAMIFQDPMSSLTPTVKIGTQLTEAVRHHKRMRAKDARNLALRTLRDVHIPAPERVYRQYPHQLSGGMRQRVMIAMALISGASLIIADEATTSLDVTIQAQILRVLRELRDVHSTSMLFISHDIGVIREIADRVIVMYGGQVVEELAVSGLDQPEHPYTKALLSAIPTLDSDRPTSVAQTTGVSTSDLAVSHVGCPFSARCPLARDQCKVVRPPLERTKRGRVACWVVNDPSQADADRGGTLSCQV